MKHMQRFFQKRIKILWIKYSNFFLLLRLSILFNFQLGFSFRQRKYDRKRKCSFTFAKFVRNFLEICYHVHVFVHVHVHVWPFLLNLFYLQKYNLLDTKWKIFDFYRTKIVRKFRKNEVENFAKIHRNSRKLWTKMNKFRSFIFANFVQWKFRWKPYFHYLENKKMKLLYFIAFLQFKSQIVFII